MPSGIQLEDILKYGLLTSIQLFMILYQQDKNFLSDPELATLLSNVGYGKTLGIRFPLPIV